MLRYKDNPGVYAKLETLNDFAEQVPGVVIVHDIKDGSVAWMSKLGVDLLGVSFDEITSIQSSEYYARFFNTEDAEVYVPKILNLLEQNNDSSFCTYFQQVKTKNNVGWTWYMSSTKIFMRDELNEPLLTLTVAMPMDAMHHMTQKAEKLLEENNFLKSHYKAFDSLSVREREILTLVALGKSTNEIAESLFISELTVNTHKRNIKTKLNTSTTADLIKFARAFDLI